MIESEADLPLQHTKQNARTQLDIIHGIHAGIPECCIEFYCCLGEVTSFQNAFANEMLERHPLTPRIGYVACPRCWDGIASGQESPVLLHHCRRDSLNLCCILMNYFDPEEFMQRIKDHPECLGELRV